MDYKKVYPILKTLVNTKDTLYQNFEIQRRNETDFNLVKYNDLVSENILRERNFKLEVLDWLTNGKPKLFKSATEGNYLVRLMNTSLAPNDQLGRMLHTFTSTAYEIADLTYESMVANGIIAVSNESENNQYLKISTIPFSTLDNNFVGLNDHITYLLKDGRWYAAGPLVKNGETVEWASITDMTPGSIILVDGEPIMIGSTGTYEIEVPVSQIILGSMTPVGEDFSEEIFDQNTSKKYYIKTDSNIYVLADSKYEKDFHYYENDFIYSSGQMTYGYYGELNDTFSQIVGTDLKEVIGQQIIGAQENVITTIEDLIKKVVSFYDIKIKKRPIEQLYLIEREIPLEEDEVWPEDEPRPTEEIFVDNMGNLIGRPYILDRILLESVENKNPLLLNQYNCPVSYRTGAPLYCNVKFLNLDTSDEYHLKEMNEKYFENYPQGIPPASYDIQMDYYEQIRYPNKRASTAINPYLKDYRDFELYAKNGGLFAYTPMDGFVEVDESFFDYTYTKPNQVISREDFEMNEYYVEVKKGVYEKAAEYNPYAVYYVRASLPKDFPYFIPENYEFISDGSEVYITDECYRKLQQTYKVLGWDQNELTNLYKKYSANVFIDGQQNIDVSQTEYFSTGPLEKVGIIQTSFGVYLELFYQQQILNYDISKNKELQSKKDVLDQYDKILSKQYMIEQCIEKKLADLYILELNDVYYNYERKYAEYLSLLQQYLNSLEREG